MLRSAVVGRVHGLVHAHCFLAGGPDVHTNETRFARSKCLAQRGFKVLGAIDFARGETVSLRDQTEQARAVSFCVLVRNAFGQLSNELGGCGVRCCRSIGRDLSAAAKIKHEVDGACSNILVHFDVCD